MKAQLDRLAVCAVSSYNYLHCTLALIRSIRKYWKSNPVVYVALIDGSDRPRPGFDQFHDVIFVPAEDLHIANLTWLRLKHDAGQMCTVVRPFALLDVLARGHKEVFYCDSDVAFFDDAVSLLAEGPSADFVVTPHMLAPPPPSDVWHHANIGHVTGAGIINNGMFLCRNTAPARKFLQQYGTFMAGPGAALDELGSMRDQHFFNWIVSFGAQVHLSSDKLSNVAYWNLHERPVRWSKLDGGPADRWTIDGRPLVSFHFSGFDWDSGSLSRYDPRPTVLWNASLHALGEFYRAELRACLEDFYARASYVFEAVGGVPLTRDIRLELKRSERIGVPATTEWDDNSPRVFEHLNAERGSKYLVPAYLDRIVCGRGDLQALIGGNYIHSRFLMSWANEFFDREYKVGAVWDRFAPFAFHRGFVRELAGAIAPYVGQEASAIEARLKSDRRALAAEMVTAGAPRHLSETVATAAYRYAAVLPAQCIRLVYEGWATLRTAFADPLGNDFPSFRAWLRDDFLREFDMPAAVREFAAAFDIDACLARVIGFARRNAGVAKAFRATGLSQDVLRAMMGFVNFRLGFTADDLIVVDWWLIGRSASDIGVLGNYAPDDVGTPSGNRYIESRRGDFAIAARAPDAADATTYVAALAGGDIDVNAGASVSTNRAARFVARAQALAGTSFLPPEPAGINVFGYFKSPIGIGVASKGLSKALTAASFKVRENLLLADAMDADLSLNDLRLDFAFAYPRTLVVSYPHIGYRQSEILPGMFTRGRETIGYLAWEQRDFPLQWRPIVDQYDTVCALSKFAAESIARGIGRPVHALPCVVEIGAPISKSAARRLQGIPDDKFVVGFCFDAGSSTDRKNPMAFAEAVVGAFAGRSDVLVLVKYASAARPDFAERFAAFRERMARSGLDHRIVTDYIDRAQVEAMIAAMDVYVSLHRSEGFGYTLAEAMMLGVPAVATGYSGNLDFMTEENSHLVRYTESVVRRRDGPFDIGSVWAEPDIDDAIDKLRAIYANYASAQEKAARAKRDVEATVSVAAVAKRLKEIIG